MSGAHTVSVALCTYNGAKYIAEQVSSILRQSAKVDELVVSDDGSTDGTLEIIRATARALGTATTIRIMRNPGRAGVTANFENAVAACRGDIIVLSDQDDRWHEDRVKELVARLDAEPHTGLVFSDARLVDAGGKPLGATLFDWLDINDADLEALHSPQAFPLLQRRNLVTGATVGFRRRLLDSALPFAEEWVHDEWLAIIAAVSGPLAVIRAPLIDYRQHGANQIGVASPTFRRKLSRMLEPRADRNRQLARRSAALVLRLTELGADANLLESARAKAQFESARAALPASRLRRIRPVLQLARTGDYARFASQGTADIGRDLLQPA